MKTKSTLLILFLGAFFTLHLPVFRDYPINEDILMMSNASRVLTETGNLESVGDRTLYQALRSDSPQPFWYIYFGPTVMYWPFVSWFGATDFSIYLCHSLLWGLLLWGFARSLGSFQSGLVLITILILTGSITLSTYVTPSALPFLVGAVFLWPSFFKTRDSKHLALLGVVFGLCLHFRPESFFLLLAFIASQLTIASNEGVLRRAVSLFGSIAVVYGSVLGLRFYWGATGSWDHAVYNLGFNILAPEFETLSMATVPTAWEFFSDPVILKKLSLKLVRNLYAYGLLQGNILRRPDSAMLWVFLGVAALRYIPLRAFLVLVSLFSLQLLINCGVYDDARYADYLFVLMSLVLYGSLAKLFAARWKGVTSRFGVSLAPVTAVLVLFLCGQSWKTFQTRKRETVAFAAEMQKSERAHALIPQDALVASDAPALWQWYGAGQKHIFAPWTPQGMGSLLQAYPNVYVILFRNFERVHPETESVLAARPLLYESAEMRIYGSAQPPPPGSRATTSQTTK